MQKEGFIVLKYFKEKKYRNELIILLAWLLVQFGLIWKNGIVTEGESEKYISQARLLITQGSLSSASYVMYLTQILLIAAVKKLGLGVVAVVAIQLFLNLVATIQYFKLGRQLFSSEAFAMVSCLALLLNFPLQEFNSFLQTESIFYSLGIIVSCFVLKQETFNLKKFLILVFLLGLLCITRPTGILFIPALLMYVLFRFLPAIKFSHKLIIVGAGTVIFVFMLNAALGSGGELDFMLPYRYQEIICGVPTIPDSAKINEASNANSVFGLLYYVFHNFGQFVQLAWLRSIAFFGLSRSYYSTIHNAYLVGYFYLTYVFVIISIGFWTKKYPHVLFYILFLTFLFCACAMLSCDDWHNRFFLTLSPYLFILALPGAGKLFPKHENHASRRGN